MAKSLKLPYEIYTSGHDVCSDYLHLSKEVYQNLVEYDRCPQHRPPSNRQSHDIESLFLLFGDPKKKCSTKRFQQIDPQRILRKKK